MASTTLTIPNTSPTVTSPSVFYMDEDEGKAVLPLTATDVELDDFYFALDPSKSYIGTVVLSSSGLLEVTPLDNFAGKISVDFEVSRYNEISNIVDGDI